MGLIMTRNDDFKLKNHYASTSILLEYLHKKALNHNTYRIYTNADYLYSWVNEDGLFLSDGSAWNDVQDRELFQASKAERRFGICFSFSISENVAMWMLYGGMKHRGVVVPFMRSEIKQIRETKTVEFGKWKGNDFKAYKELSAESGDFWFELVDLVYYGDSVTPNSYDIKRSDERVNGVPKTIIDSIDFAKKAYPWAYENECRFVVHVNRNAIEGFAGNTIKIPLHDMYSEVIKRVACSPNYEGEPLFLNSKLKGKIDWDLCNKCDSKAKTI